MHVKKDLNPYIEGIWAVTSLAIFGLSSFAGWKLSISDLVIGSVLLRKKVKKAGLPSRFGIGSRAPLRWPPVLKMHAASCS